MLTFRRAALVAVVGLLAAPARRARRDGRADRSDGDDTDQGEAGADVDGARRAGAGIAGYNVYRGATKANATVITATTLHRQRRDRQHQLRATP